MRADWLRRPPEQPSPLANAVRHPWQGESALNGSATIVLPIHNGERTLRDDVEGVLSLALGMTDAMQVVIVDDGSTDETFETACELASRYPQVRVIRQPFQRGLSAALDRVRRTCAVSEVIVHDGVGRIDLEELATMLRPTEPAPAPASASDSRGSRRFAAVASLNARMQSAHQRVMGFRRLAIEPGIEPRRRSANSVPLSAGLLNALGSAPVAQS